MKSKVTLYSAPGCAFCHDMIKKLEQLKSNETIKEFTVIDVSAQNDEAERLNIKSVPYILIKERIFIGNMTIEEIAHWYAKPNTIEGNYDYFNWQLNKGEILASEATLTLSPSFLTDVIQLLLKSSTQLSVKIGLMALIENYENTKLLQDNFSLIEKNSSHEDHRIRTDVTELLLLSQHPNTEKLLVSMSQDEHPDVVEAAKDALETLTDAKALLGNDLH